MKKKKFFIGVVLFVFGFYFSYASNLSFDAALSTATKYVWRGQLLYDRFCLQPNLNFYLGNFTFNYWGSFPVEQNSYIESDFSFIASEKIPSIDFVNVSAGFIIYTFPNNSPNLKNTLEIFGAVNLNTFLAPYVKLFYDSVLGNGYYLETGISNSLSLIDAIHLNLYANTGYNFNQWNYEPSFTTLNVTEEISYTLNNFSLTVSTTQVLSLNTQYNNDYFFMFGLKYSN